MGYRWVEGSGKSIRNLPYQQQGGVIIPLNLTLRGSQHPPPRRPVPPRLAPPPRLPAPTPMAPPPSHQPPPPRLPAPAPTAPRWPPPPPPPRLPAPTPTAPRTTPPTAPSAAPSTHPHGAPYHPTNRPLRGSQNPPPRHYTPHPPPCPAQPPRLVSRFRTEKISGGRWKNGTMPIAPL